MGYTHRELRTELRRLGKRDHEMALLLHPQEKSLTHYPNIRVGFTSLADWLDDQPEPQQRPLRAALAKYLLAQSAYRKATLEQFAALEKHDVPKAVLAEVKSAAAWTLTVMPYRPEDENDVNASSSPNRQRGSTWLGFPLRDSDGDVIRGAGRGTGGGSSVTINFSPEMWGATGTAHFSGPASDPDEVLCHELVHAGRQMNGKRHKRAVDGDYDNEEEFVSIVVTNIYLSEKKQVKLRGSHKTLKKREGDKIVARRHDLLPHPERFLENPQGISPTPKELMEKIRNRQPKLWHALIKLKKPAFNPPRDWEPHRKDGLIDL
jgi:Effector protein